MPRTRTANKHARTLRMPVDEEMFVGHVGIKANDRIQCRSGKLKQKRSHDFMQAFDFLRVNFAIHGVRGCRKTFMMPCHLDPVSELGKSIKVSVRFVLKEVNGTMIGTEHFWLLLFE